MMIDAYIGLGSNLEDPQHQVEQAIQQLREFPHSQFITASALYTAKPWGEGTENQPDYVNAVVWLRTTLEAQALLAALLQLEQQHGRSREKRYAPRTLDCDLLLYGTQKIATETLIVPHPQLTFRAFVLLPLFEINPQLLIEGQPLTAYLMACDCSGLKKLA